MLKKEAGRQSEPSGSRAASIHGPPCWHAGHSWGSAQPWREIKTEGDTGEAGPTMGGGGLIMLVYPYCQDQNGGEGILNPGLGVPGRQTVIGTGL